LPFSYLRAGGARRIKIYYSDKEAAKMFGGDMLAARLVREMDLASLRQRVIANNLANLNTVGFKRSYVSFSRELETASGRLAAAVTHPRHLPQTNEGDELRVETERHTAVRADGNNVDLEREMLDMVANQLHYHTIARQLNARLANWQYVINEGSR
jgi:flagellar basal-body rod protein FlgB